jgi:hypothetical protein
MLCLKKDDFLLMTSLLSQQILWIFTEHQIMFYVSNFVVEILLILTYDLHSVDQTVNNSPFYVMWVVRIEVQITTSMSILLIHFCGQFWTLFHNQNIQEWKSVISFNFQCEFDLMIGLTLLRW